MCLKRRYLELLDYSDRNILPNDLIVSIFDQPIILLEENSKLDLEPIRFIHEERSILNSSFKVKLSKNFPLSVAKTITIVPNERSSKKILAIETQIIESIASNSYWVNIKEIAPKAFLLNKKIKKENDIEVSGKIVYGINKIPFANKQIILLITQSQKCGLCMNKIRGFTQQIQTDQNGFFKTNFSLKRPNWDSEGPFNLQISIKFITEIEISFTDKNGLKQNEKVALISLSKIKE
jgi:hypothetical protein